MMIISLLTAWDSRRLTMIAIAAVGISLKPEK